MIGSNIQSRRKMVGLTQEQLAERLGVSRQTVTKWETGDSTPTWPMPARWPRRSTCRWDALVGYDPHGTMLPMPPRGKHLFGHRHGGRALADRHPQAGARAVRHRGRRCPVGAGRRGAGLGHPESRRVHGPRVDAPQHGRPIAPPRWATWASSARRKHGRNREEEGRHDRSRHHRGAGSVHRCCVGMVRGQQPSWRGARPGESGRCWLR